MDAQSHIPICVDLDGTLVRTDTLLEAFIKMVKRQPLTLFASVWWLRRGRSYFKHQIGRRVSIDPRLLPYNQAVLQWIKQEKATGRQICLATGSDNQIARSIADHLQIFDQVIGSDGTNNVAGQGKADALVKRFGHKNYDYAGNSRADLPVWRAARQAIIVNAPPAVAASADRLGNVVKKINNSPNTSTFDISLRSIRVHQWVKNFLLLVPLFASHQFTDSVLLIRALVGMVVFSLTASAVYLLNDMLDLESDRSHPQKKNRPLAAGLISIDRAAALAVALLFISLVVSYFFLPLSFLLLLLIYLVLNFGYSVSLKKILWVDVIVLSGFYVIRLLAGASAVGIVTSIWLLAFAGLIFFSLALVKRSSELFRAAAGNRGRVAGRAYSVGQARPVLTLGVSSGYASLLVFGFYINSTAATPLYSRPQLLWILLPVLFAWITRIWLLAMRGRINEDPIVFAGQDSFSYLTAITCTIIVLLAT